MRGKLISAVGAVVTAAAGVVALAGPAHAVPYEPDAMLREKGSLTWLGDDFISDSAQAPQNIEDVVPRNQGRKFEMRFENDGEQPDKLEIDDVSFQKGGKWEFKAKIGPTNVTNLLKGPGFYLTRKLQPGEGVKVKLSIFNQDAGAGGMHCECLAWQLAAGSRKNQLATEDSVRVLLENEEL